MDALQWMGAIRMRVQTADKNITIIHTTPVHQLMSYKAESCVFVRKWCGLLVDYCDVFISCLDSHSDGTHSLQSIHWWISDGILHFSKSDEETNSATSQMAWEWAHTQQIITFRWTIHFKYLICRSWHHSHYYKHLFYFSHPSAHSCSGDMWVLSLSSC